MADFSYTQNDELHKLNNQVLAQPEEFENWEKLVRAAESQEGGLHRNSSPQAIAATRETYDRFLARFPLFFGYWKKYADLEFAIGGTEAAEMVYERGVASIGVSVDLWAHYCGFKVETSHDPDVIRELFERAANSVGLDFLAHPFWDKYLEYEERLESHDKIFAILGRIIHLPLHQYARYFERYRTMAALRPISQLAPADTVSQFNIEIEQESGKKPMSPADLERNLRARVDAYHLEIFHRTQAETTKRWTYEQEVKRPYYHVTELDDSQLTNWRNYLDFEEAEGDYLRTKFLYERCMVTAANYEEFWYRYARWMSGQSRVPDVVRNEETRNIYQRASCIYVFQDEPEIRLYWARFEESLGKADTAIAIHEAVLINMPAHLETMISLVNTYRRQYGVDAAIEEINKQISNQAHNSYVRGALVSELARLTWKIKGDADAARNVFTEARKKRGLEDCKRFWVDWLLFERDQPTSEKEEPQRYERVRNVYITACGAAPAETDIAKELSAYYLEYLEQRGGQKAMEEYMRVDRQINGPASVSAVPSELDIKTEGKAQENGTRIA